MTLQQWAYIGEIIAAGGVIASLIYLAVQVRTSNRLARAEAFRTPNTELNSVNASYATDPTFRTAWRKVLNGAKRDELESDERILVDYFVVSHTNIQEQLVREVQEGILDPDALDFGGKGLFWLPYFQTSWPLYRPFLSSAFVEEFEKRYKLDPSVEATW